MNETQAIGMAAAFCTTLSFVPQVWRVWKTRSAKDISLGMYGIFVSGVAMWLVYGLRVSDPAIIAANAVTLVLAGSVLAMKLIFDRNEKCGGM
ncbi:MAG: SemiSWEET transporter [Limnobacter sp.]|nr:SemiSWEET transporter [Limnobacter sp.]